MVDWRNFESRVYSNSRSLFALLDSMSKKKDPIFPLNMIYNEKDDRSPVI